MGAEPVDFKLLLSRDTSFRNALLKNVTVNPYVKDFWLDEFEALSPTDRRQEVEPLLSRLNSFVRNTMLRHIVGQGRSTIDFHTILNTSPTPHIVLLRMPVNLPDTVKSVIGTLLIGEMLAAAFDRDQLPEAERRYFALYCDEFQMFATQDFAKLFTQTGKFKIMPHVAHQVREGQLKPDDPNTGATLAAPIKIFFSLSITDSGKVAPLMAKRVETTEKRREAQLVISPSPVEDIWERGHPPPEVMKIRGQYFWVVQHLRNNPNEKSFVFDPFQVSPEYRRENPVTFNFTEFADWEYYRSSADMLRRGISLLNQYYYDWMGQRYDPDKPATDVQLELIIQVIVCWGGVLGFLPMLRPVLPEEKRSRLAYMMTEKRRQQFEQDKRDKIQIARDKLKQCQDRLAQLRYWAGNEWQTPLRILPGMVTGRARQEHRDNLIKWISSAEKQEKELWQQIETLEKSLPPGAPYIPRTLSSPRDISDIQRMAIEAGMSGSEVEQLIEWEVKPLTSMEKGALADMVTMLVNRDIDRAQYENNGDRIYQHYAAAMSQRLSQPGVSTERATRRAGWQIREVRLFIDACFRVAPRVLAKEPLKVPSGKYDESLTVERLQNDLIAEMGLELSRLPPRTAYVHVLQAQDGVQVVRQAKIQTLPLDPPHGQAIMDAIIEHSHEVAYKPRQEIEAEIRVRQQQWRRGSDDDPPPTRTGGNRPPPRPPKPTETKTEPPPTQYTPAKAPEEKPSRSSETARQTDGEEGSSPLPAQDNAERQEAHAAQEEPTRETKLPPPLLGLTSLNFFESDTGPLQKELPDYRLWFPKDATRHVNFELRVRNLLYGKRDQTYELIHRWYNPDGSLMAIATPYNWVIKADTEQTWLKGGRGWEEPGHWEPGDYRLEILMNGVKFTEGSFKILKPRQRRNESKVDGAQRSTPESNAAMLASIRQRDTLASDPTDADFLRAAIRVWWKKLTEADLRKIAGQKDRLIDKLQERYGYTKEAARQEVDRRFREYNKVLPKGEPPKAVEPLPTSARQPEPLTGDRIDENFLKDGITLWWKKLTEADVLRIAGQKDKLNRMLQEKYGYTREAAGNEIDRHFRYYNEVLPKGAPLRSWWDRLTDVDVWKIDGKKGRLLSALQERYDDTRDALWQEMDRRLRTYKEVMASRAAPQNTSSDEILSALALELRFVAFYESDKNRPKKEERGYRSRFRKSTTRFVHWEIHLRNLLYKQRNQTYQIIGRFYDPDGSLLKEEQSDWEVKSEWNSCWYSMGWGWDEPGQWAPGTYRVEILINGGKFTDGVFTIE